MPKVTVIVPNFNHERYLPRRLAGIMEQSYRDFEIVLLDDFSTDNSRSVLSEFARDCRLPVKVAFNETNSGSSFKQWRKGAEMASGEFLWIAESDDDALPEFLSAAMTVLSQRPSAGLVYCQSTLIDANGTEIGSMLSHTKRLDPDRWRADFFNDGRDECAKYLCQYNSIPNASAVVVRREALLATDPFYDGMRLTGDWIKWSEILLSSDVAFIAEPLNRFRLHPLTVRKTTARSRFLDEMSIVRAFITNAFGGEPAVGRRALKATLNEWRELAPLIDDSDSVSWFLSYLNRVRQLGWLRTLPITSVYLKSRVLHWQGFHGLRLMKQRISKMLRPGLRSAQ